MNFPKRGTRESKVVALSSCILLAVLLMFVLTSSGCLTMVTESIDQPTEAIANATCTDICLACERCTEKLSKDGG